ncbi:ABC transporter permease [Streptomyces sp. ME19-01-6]|uniref:ABC transporter permease n=1 Tax=Streptomyces sp. ME19-01-6 TaxID=3028686 RepID=UPI0029A9B726|nr:ABC transporter permease subunit [Streptomyces sp. ME19-01-6]MDX3229347.1 ABC transporter permease subunit [Streptomyces sp. ME19-01-6]
MALETGSRAGKPRRARSTRRGGPGGPDDSAASAPPPTAPDGVPDGGIRWWQRLRRDRTLLLMVAPAVGLLLLFNYVPLIWTTVAFKDYDPFTQGLWTSPWVGFDNFTLLFEDNRFWDAFANTLGITFIQLVLFFPLTIALALLVNSVLSERIRGVVQSILYLPHFFSWVLVITVFQQMLGGAGLLAQQLRQHGYEGFDLMTDPGVFKFLVSAQLVWKDGGWGVIVFLAALSAVSQDLYEAAAVDGANRWRRMWHVTLPALRPVIALLLVLRVGDSLTVGFEQILLQRDAVGPGASEVFDTYVWWVGIANTDYGIAAAGGLIKGVFSLVLVLIANKVAHMLGEQGVYQK